MAGKLKKKSGDEHRDSPWKSRLVRMIRHQEKGAKNWDRNKKLLFGETESAGGKDNLYAFGWGLVKSLETAIYVQNPEMAVEPYDGTKMEMGRLLTSISNYDMDQMDIKSIGNLGLVDCFVNGFFACIETIETDMEVVRFPGEDEDTERPTDQRFGAYRIAPKDFLVDPKCRKLDLSDADYCAVAFYPTIAALKADKKFTLPPEIEDYPEASAEKPPSPRTRGQGTGGGSVDIIPGGEKDPEYKTICVWEIHDKIKKEIVYLTDHKMEEIGTIPWPVQYKIGGRDLFPITLMAFHQVPDQFWPKPEIDLIAPQLMNLNKLDQAIIQDALEKWRKFITLVGLLSGDQSAKVTDMTAVNALIQVDREDIKELAQLPNQYPDIKDLVVPLQDPSPKKDMLAVRDMLKQEIMDILGYGPPDRAGMPRTRSAREAVAVKEKLEARLAKRADAVADFYRNFGQKHIMAVQQKAVVDRYVKVFESAKNLTEFKKYSKEDIQSGLFNFIVYAGTSMPRNTEAKRNTEMQILQTLMPLAQAGKIAVEPIIIRFAEAMQWKGIDALLRNPKPAAAMLAKVLMAANSQQIPPNALPEAAAALVQAVLTPEEIKLIMKDQQPQGAAPVGQRGESDASRQEVGGVS